MTDLSAVICLLGRDKRNHESRRSGVSLRLQSALLSSCIVVVFTGKNSVVSCLSRALGPALHHFGLHASPSSYKRAKSICVAVAEADKVNVTDRSRTLNARVPDGNLKRNQQYTSNFNHMTCKMGFVCALVVEELRSSGVGTWLSKAKCSVIHSEMNFPQLRQ